MVQFLILALLCFALTAWFKGLHFISVLIAPLMVTVFPIYAGYDLLEKGKAIGWLLIAIGAGFSYGIYKLVIAGPKK